MPVHGRTRLHQLATEGRWGPRVIIATDRSVMKSGRKLRRIIRSLTAAAGIQLIVVPDARLRMVESWLPRQRGERPPLMVNSVDDFDPFTEVGVPTLAIIDEGMDPGPFLDGSSRSSLFVVLGPSDLRVGGSGLALSDSDSAFRLDDLERIL